MTPGKQQWGQGEYSELEPIVLFPPSLNIWTRVKQDSNVKCSLEGLTKPHTSAPPDSRPVPPMWAGDSCCSLGVGLSTDLCTQPGPNRPRPALSFPSRSSPPASTCSCTETTRGDCICLALERLCSPLGTTASWPSTTVCVGQ